MPLVMVTFYMYLYIKHLIEYIMGYVNTEKN